ncbi:hypothetical protein O6P43_007004 [Quillaja saponaria]|uniref:Uncharacterized protein n=1 Tax=Quillaja saponaria TaxID=32244 RepID=A0AAD7VIV8_QUISA|nr:hypothetical protein O6P43_007004 [Quillaja saponaria]
MQFANVFPLSLYCQAVRWALLLGNLASLVIETFCYPHNLKEATEFYDFCQQLPSTESFTAYNVVISKSYCQLLNSGHKMYIQSSLKGHEFIFLEALCLSDIDSYGAISILYVVNVAHMIPITGNFYFLAVHAEEEY